MVADRPAAEEAALAAYGDNLGIAFQLIDDALDYSARQAQLGKSVGDDFREGKITLPVLLAFARGGETERAFWRRTLEDLEQREGDLEHAQDADRPPRRHRGHGGQGRGLRPARRARTSRVFPYSRAQAGACSTCSISAPAAPTDGDGRACAPALGPTIAAAPRSECSSAW